MPRSKVVKLKKVNEQRGHEDDPMNLITHLVINVLALLVVDYLLPGMGFRDLMSTLVAAVVIGIINTYIRPIVQILALPFSLLTLGLTALLINVGLLWLASIIVPGFEIDGFTTALVASVLLTLTGWVLHRMARK